ncbi:MAG: flagellar biosynthetic protein FliR [Rhodospirillaceae bacterium]
MTLNDYLAINVFHFLLVFARLSVVFLLMPGISAVYVPMRIRLILAVLVTILVLPLVAPLLPSQPESPAELVWLIVAESLIGGFMGALIQIIMSALELAAFMISNAVGITNALIDDPVTEEQTSIITGFLALIAVALIFITGVHHFILEAMVQSYTLLRPAQPLFTGDMLQLGARLLDQAFTMGLRLAAPFIVYELVFQITSGVLARLSPQLNVFFVAIPGKIILGIAVLMVSLPVMMLLFMKFLESNMVNFLR